MVELNRNVKVIESKPITMKKEWACYWAEKEGVLIGGQDTKIKRYIEDDCIKKLEGGYDILPIPGTKKINHIRNGHCNCQHHKTFGTECSHMKAVKIFEYMNNFNERRTT
jgi:hypothetical protein